MEEEIIELSYRYDEFDVSCRKSLAARNSNKTKQKLIQTIRKCIVYNIVGSPCPRQDSIGWS